MVEALPLKPEFPGPRTRSIITATETALTRPGPGIIATRRRLKRRGADPAFGATRGRLPRRAFWDTLLCSGAPST